MREETSGTVSIEEIRKRRVVEWLPDAMRESGVDLFLIFTREGAPDPLAEDLGLGGIGGRAAGLFRFDKNGSFARTAIAAKTSVMRVEASGIYDTVTGSGQDGIGPQLSGAIRSAAPKVIAVNTSRSLAIADGLTTGMHDHLLELIGPALSATFVSSESIVLSILGRRFPEEIAAIEGAAVAIQEILSDVLSPQVMRPGSKVGVIADAIEERAKARLMDVAFCTIRIGGRSPNGAAMDDSVRAGDVITIDAGVRNQGYCSDIQRTAYILGKGEKTAPGEIQRMWDVTLAAQEAAVASLLPGSTGLAVDSAARRVVQDAGFSEFPHATGHSLGRRVHDVGPLLGPFWPQYGSLVHRRIEPGQVFAIEPMVYAGVASQGGEVRMGLEENVVVEVAGARTFGVPQRRLILID